MLTVILGVEPSEAKWSPLDKRQVAGCHSVDLRVSLIIAPLGTSRLYPKVVCNRDSTVLLLPHYLIEVAYVAGGVVGESSLFICVPL